MTDNIITARLFIDMDGTLAAWQQAACFEDLLQENYFRDLPPYQTVVDAVRILCNAHPELDIYALSAFMPENPASVEEKYGWLDVYVHSPWHSPSPGGNPYFPAPGDPAGPRRCGRRPG